MAKWAGFGMRRIAGSEFGVKIKAAGGISAGDQKQNHKNPAQNFKTAEDKTADFFVFFQKPGGNRRFNFLVKTGFARPQGNAPEDAFKRLAGEQAVFDAENSKESEDD